jgi:hypothetical protein
MRRVYKVVHSDSEEMTVYRRVYWNSGRKTGLIGFASIALLSLGTFMLIPTPEDVLSVGWLARLFTKHYGISVEQGVLYGLLAVKGIAALLIIVASVLGGEYVREKFHKKVMENTRGIFHSLNSSRVQVVAKVDRHREKLADWIRPKPR